MEYWKEGHTVEKVMKTERSGGKSCEVRMVQVRVELGTIPGIDGDERSAARTRTYRLILRTLILILTEYRLEYTKSSLARACRYA